MDRMMAELMGREDGYCSGLGGSMHIAALELNILGANGIVGAGVPIGAGAALAASSRAPTGSALAFFGDGGANEGMFHETHEHRRRCGSSRSSSCARTTSTRSPRPPSTPPPARSRQARARATACPARASTATTSWLSTTPSRRRSRGRARGEGPTLHRGGHLPLGRPQHAREPARLPDQGRGEGVDRARPRSPASHGVVDEEASADADALRSSSRPSSRPSTSAVRFGMASPSRPSR